MPLLLPADAADAFAAFAFSALMLSLSSSPLFAFRFSFR